jgi:hypothetical protein
MCWKREPILVGVGCNGGGWLYKPAMDLPDSLNLKFTSCCDALILTSLCGCAKLHARDISPLYSPSLYLNLTHPYPSLPAFLCALHRLTSAYQSCLGVLIPGRAAIESINSWREGVKGARTGSGITIIGPWYQDRLLDLLF